MVLGLRDRLDLWLRRATPGLLTACASLLSLISWPLPGIAHVAPPLSLMAVYCWAVWRPSLMPYVIAFGLGVIEDAMRGMPIGTTAAMLVLIQGFGRSQRRVLYGRGFWLFWIVFAAIGAVALAFEWGVMALAAETLPDTGPAFGRFLLLVALFPAVAWLLLRLDRHVAPAVQAS